MLDQRGRQDGERSTPAAPRGSPPLAVSPSRPSEAWDGLPKSGAILISAGLCFFVRGSRWEPKSCFALWGWGGGGGRGQEKCCQTATALARAPARGPDLPELVLLQGLPHLQLRCPTSAAGHSSPCPGDEAGSPVCPPSPPRAPHFCSPSLSSVPPQHLCAHCWNGTQWQPLRMQTAVIFAVLPSKGFSPYYQKGKMRHGRGPGPSLKTFFPTDMQLPPCWFPESAPRDAQEAQVAASGTSPVLRVMETPAQFRTKILG